MISLLYFFRNRLLVETSIRVFFFNFYSVCEIFTYVCAQLTSKDHYRCIFWVLYFHTFNLLWDTSITSGGDVLIIVHITAHNSQSKPWIVQSVLAALFVITTGQLILEWYYTYNCFLGNNRNRLDVAYQSLGLGATAAEQVTGLLFQGMGQSLAEMLLVNILNYSHPSRHGTLMNAPDLALLEHVTSAAMSQSGTCLSLHHRIRLVRDYRIRRIIW